MKKLLPAFVTICSLLSSSALAASDYDDGIKDYNAGRYEQSAVKLARASGEDPRNALTHYYLANALAQLHQHQEAAREYRLCYILDPAGTVSDFCKQALAGYRMPLPDEREIKQERATIYGGKPPALPGKSGQGEKAGSGGTVWQANAQRGGNAVQQSLSVIRRQLQYEKAKNHSYSDVSAEESLQEANDLIKRARERMEAEISRMWSQPNLRTNTATQLYMQGREAQIRAAEKEEEERITRECAMRAERYKKVGEMKDSALDQVAKNLESQMSDNSFHGGVKLIPEGTDLYVRRYASEGGSRAVPDAHAAVARIYGQPSGGSAVAPQTADELNGSLSRAAKTVRGKLLNPETMRVWGPIRL